ncbi:hypothetical protein PsorP6_005396 [Peronosclerospora sorghi]|uniref:Uncharacterized protein n=1 Tax=Peronosclerospora sorghi TaxID=230839 RepID=A0ACC0W2X1_9STRA|nr:hypothetical protein PsorP6_005396 [Peronosclerospora sorghi]
MEEVDGDGTREDALFDVQRVSVNEVEAVIAGSIQQSDCLLRLMKSKQLTNRSTICLSPSLDQFEGHHCTPIADVDACFVVNLFIKTALLPMTTKGLSLDFH